MTYTPTTREVKEWYADSIDRLGGEGEFERWLAEELRKAKETAWDKGVTESGLDLDYLQQLLGNNPYRSQS